MNKHTPELWEVDDELQICVRGSVIALINDRGRAYADEDSANAIRIVACVNALAGIENPADLRQQRDELLKCMGMIAWSNDSKWQSDCAKDAIARCK